MPVVSKYCDKCGIKIPVEDFEDGHALEYEQAYYCRKCKGSVVPVTEPAEPAPPSPPPPPAPPPPAEPPVRKAPRSRRLEKITGRKRAPAPKEEEKRPAPPKPGKKPAAPAAAKPKAPVKVGKKPSAPVKAGKKPSAPVKAVGKGVQKGAAPAKGVAKGVQKGSAPVKAVGKGVQKGATPVKKGTPVKRPTSTREAAAGRKGAVAGKATPSGRRPRPASSRGEKVAGRRGSGRLAARAVPPTRKRVAEQEPDTGEEVPEEVSYERKGFGKYLLIGGIGAMVVGAILIFLVVALGDRDGDGDGDAAESAPSDETAAAEVDKARPPQDEVDILDGLKVLIGDFPDHLSRIEEQVIIARAQIKHPSLKEELETLWQAARDDAYRLLGQSLDEVLQLANDLKESEEYDLALETLRDAPDELRDSEMWGRVTELQDEIARYKRVEDEVGYYEARAARFANEGRFAEAQGTLDAINLDDYKDTPIYARVQSLIERYRNAKWTEEDRAALDSRQKENFETLKARVEKYATAASKEYDLARQILEAEMKKYEGTEYEQQIRDLLAMVKDAMTRDLLDLAARGKGVPLIGTNLLYWSIRDGAQSKGVWELDKEKKTLKGNATTGTFIGYNNNRWKDYIIEFQFKKHMGSSKAFLAMRVAQASGGLEFAKIPLERSGTDWQTYRFVVWGEKFYEVDLDAKEVREVKASTRGQLHEKGAIGFKLEGGSQVSIRGAIYREIKKG